MSDENKGMAATNNGEIIEIIKCFYESARLELIQRIILRDRASNSCAIGSAALIGVWLTHPDPVIGCTALFFIPIVSICASAVICQHNSVIGLLGVYCSKEISGKLNDIGININHWDNSQAQTENHSASMFNRYIAHFTILIVPCIVSCSVLLKGLIGLAITSGASLNLSSGGLGSPSANAIWSLIQAPFALIVSIISFSLIEISREKRDRLARDVAGWDKSGVNTAPDR